MNAKYTCLLFVLPNVRQIEANSTRTKILRKKKVDTYHKLGEKSATEYFFC